jgi:hypothetical protein
MQQTISRKARILEVLNEAASATTAHGIPSIAKNSNYFLKFMWTICLIASTGLCSYLVVESIVSYYDYEVVTKINVVYQNPAEFPTITICNIKPIYGDFLKNLLSFYLNTPPQQFEGYIAFHQLFTQYPIMANLYNYSDEIKKSFGLPIEKFLWDCSFNFKKCSGNDFKWVYNFFFGNCFQFNTNGTEKSTKTGKAYGFNVQLFVGDPNATQAGITTQSGVLIYIHNKTDQINMFNGIEASVGTSTNIAIRKMYSNKIEQPYSDCVENEEKLKSSVFYNKIVAFNKSYKQTDCFDLCFSHHLFKNCSCYEGSTIEYFAGKRSCENETELSCLNTFNTVFFAQENLKEICDCPLECHSVVYTTSISFSDFPSPDYSRWLLTRPDVLAAFSNSTHEINENTLKRSLVSVSLYFDDLKYTVIDETEKIQVIDLISGIGGKDVKIFIFKSNNYLIRVFFRNFGSFYWCFISQFYRTN